MARAAICSTTPQVAFQSACTVRDEAETDTLKPFRYGPTCDSIDSMPGAVLAPGRRQ